MSYAPSKIYHPHCQSLENFFSLKANYIFENDEARQLSNFFCLEIQKIINDLEIKKISFPDRHNFFYYSNGKKLKNIHKRCTPFWAACLHVSSTYDVYLKLISPKSLVGQGTYKKIKKSISFMFKWEKNEIIPTQMWLSVHVVPRTKNKEDFKFKEDLKVIEKGLKVLDLIKDLQIPHTLEKKFVFSHPSEPSYDLHWCCADFKNATRTYVLPTHPFMKTTQVVSKKIILNGFLQVGEALLRLHENGFFHGDVKPHNMLIYRNDDGRLEGVLSDFDLCEEIGNVQAKSPFAFYDFSRNFYDIASPFTDVWGFTLSLSSLFFNTSDENYKGFFELFNTACKCVDNETPYQLINFFFSKQQNILLGKMPLENTKSVKNSLIIYKQLLLALLASNHKIMNIFKNNLSFFENLSREDRIRKWRETETKNDLLTMEKTLRVCKQLEQVFTNQ